MRGWLEELGLGQYADRFEADDIDLDIVPSLTEQDLEKLGVSMGHRKRLLRAMAEVTGAPSSPAASATVASQPSRPAAITEARKVVTIVFADLIGSTTLHEQLDAESVSRLMERYYRAMRGAVEAHGGTVVKLMGDGVMVAFGVPRVAEDDAIRAVRAGIAMQAAFQTLAREEFAAVGDIGLRVGINTGEVVVAAGESDVVGDPVNVAARLQAQALNGQVVIGESTRRLVAARVTLAPLGSFALKGRAESMKAYRVESLEPALATSAAAFVGRDDELARLMTVYDAAVATPAARLAVLLGSPGLGKSRLVEEIGQRLGDAVSVVTAHCDAAGGATFAPLAAALRAFFQIETTASLEDIQTTIEAAIPDTDSERRRIAAGIAALLAGSPASPEETFFVVRRLLAALAGAKPVMLVIDDLHWAEPLLLDLVEHLVQWGSGTPLFVLVGARPELRDLRSSMVTPGGLVSDVVTLGGLDAGAAMRLAAAMIGAADLPAAVAAKVLATSEGNPLFVGELVRMLVDEGALERQGERWIVGANLAALEMPPTIHALLAARIERLGAQDRAVLERAAVVGRHFSRSAVAALLEHDGSELDARLEALRRTELIERDSGWFLGEPVLRFHHVLIRDAAYRRMLKGTRAELHEQLAQWIESQVQDAPEHDETIGWHLEQAHQHRRELGPLDASGRALGERAARRLAAAGRRALARDDAPVAAGLLGRALERLVADNPARAELALDWCEALLTSGDVAAAETAIAELGRFTGGSLPDRNPRLAAWHTCFSGQLTVLTAPQALHATADAVAAAAAELAALDDAAGEAKGHFVHALALARLGKIGSCEAALDRALAAARRADDRRRANTVLAIAPLAALWGPSPVTRASGRCLDVVRVLRITQGAPAVEAVALSCQAVLEALRGRTDAARRMLAAARKMVEDLGITQRMFETDAFGGLIDLIEGDAVAAERSLRGAYHGLRDLGLGIDAARAAALLARALLAQGRGEEAEALSRESEALAGDDLKAAIAWRGVRAEALARRGETSAAVELANEAVAIAAATDALLDHADARLALAAVLRAAGRGHDADVEQRRAIELWEAKGATLLVAGTRRTDAPAAAPSSVGIAGPIVSPRAVRRRVRPNAATAMQDRFVAPLAARDFDAIAALFHEDHREVDHPTGSTYGRSGAIASCERLFRSHDPYYEVEPLATLGESLLLVRRRHGAAGTAGTRYDVGPYDSEAIQLFEVDASGLCRSAEVFAADRLDDAVARLYQRHAELLPEGPERERAAATVRSFGARIVTSGDLDRYASVIASDFESVDHRQLSTWSMHGGDAFVEHMRALQEVAADVSISTYDVLALAPGALLRQRLHSGTERLGGGAYERSFLVLFVYDADGRLARAEWFDDDRQAEALARFEEIVAGAAPPPVVGRRVTPNAATQSTERFNAAIAARDLDALSHELSDEVEVVHHQTGTTYGRKGLLVTWRSMFHAATMVRRHEVMASLGDALALTHHTISLEGFVEDHLTSLGAVEIDEVVLIEVDAQRRIRRFEIFPVERLGDALVRLYERYAELLPEGAQRTRIAGISRSVAAHIGAIDLDRLRLVFDPLFRCVDHRVLGTWSGGSAEEMLRHYGLQLELAPDFGGRYADIVAANADTIAAHMVFHGTAHESGGRFENHLIAVFGFGRDGRLTQTDVFESEQGVEALTRFDELVGRGADGVENTASRTWRAVNDAWRARDVAGFEALHPRPLRYRDRRRLFQLDLDRTGFLDFTRPLLTMRDGRMSLDLVATRGERLALMRSTMEMEDDSVGPSVIESLIVIEVDDRGDIAAYDRWDLEDADAARVELDRRWSAHAIAGLAPYGRAGVGEPGQLDPSGARSATMGASERVRPAAIAKQTAAAAIWERLARSFDVEEWDAVRAACSSRFTWDDRRPLVGMTGDVELMIASARERVASGARVEHREVVGMAGDRVAVARVLWAGGPTGGRFEVEFLVVTEFGTDGLCTAMIHFDPADSRAAQREAWARWAAIDPTMTELLTNLGEVEDSWNAKDAQRLRVLFAEDLVVEDRRWTGTGRSEGRDAYLRSVTALWELAPQTHLDGGWFWLASAPHGGVYQCRRAGTLTEGGEFVSDFLCVVVVENGLATRLEVFEVEAGDAALARFEELRPDLLRVPPNAHFHALAAAAGERPVRAASDSHLDNAASRTMERFVRATDARDWQALADIFAASLRFDDRRPLLRMQLGREGFLEQHRVLFDVPNAHWTTSAIATRGEHLVLTRLILHGDVAGGGGPLEIDHLCLVEVDVDGRMIMIVLFEPENHDAAYAELDARWRVAHNEGPAPGGAC